MYATHECECVRGECVIKTETYNENETPFNASFIVIKDLLFAVIFHVYIYFI